MPVSIPEGVHEIQKIIIDWVGEFVENPEVSPRTTSWTSAATRSSP